MAQQIPPLRPYLLRGLHEWMEDNMWTPHLLVDVTVPGVEAPTELANDNVIQFNIASHAVRELRLANDWIDFDARFSGVNYHIHVPIDSVLGIIARENGQGMLFNEGDIQTAVAEPLQQSTPPGSSKAHGSSKKPDLKVIK